MRQRLIVFACLAAMLALAACENENHQVIELLKVPTELDWLDVVAYAGEYALPGGSAVEPGFRRSVFEYTAYVDKDTTHFVIDAGIDSKGTLVVYSERDQVSGNAATRFDFLGDEASITVTVQREYMEIAEYRITITRGEPVPTAKDVEISVEPGIGAFFIGSGVIPQFKVTAVPPSVDLVMYYQWYVNDQNNTRTGNPITNANGDSYTMQAIETMAERTMYYYVDITTVVEGKTGITQSAPCAVTFINKGKLSEKSIAMADIPAGTVTTGDNNTWGEESLDTTIVPWSTPGFKMGRNLVTWELWKTVFDYADEANYRFANEGNQGAREGEGYYNTTYMFPEPIGNKLHPVTNISWRDAVVWCNAYSEMDGLEPVYRDKAGNVLRDSRRAVDVLVDYDAIENAGYNGYRLPTNEEWKYAAGGANPAGSHWNDKVPGTATPDTEDRNELQHYIWSVFMSLNVTEVRTGEAGSLRPNQLWDGGKYVDGLYDMMGMVPQYVDLPTVQPSTLRVYYKGFNFSGIGSTSIQGLNDTEAFNIPQGPFVGFRVARNKEN